METFVSNQETLSIPIRRLHNFIYCPRLMYFEYVENVFVENADVERGLHTHRRVDHPSEVSEFPEEFLESSGKVIRSLALSSQTLGVHGIADLLREEADGSYVLYEYKNGFPGKNSQGISFPKDYDAVQLAAYVMLAEEQGMAISQAAIYYARNHEIIPVIIDDTLRSKVVQTIEAVRDAVCKPMPEPLQDDSRCLYCSLYSVCLPQETRYWKHQTKPLSVIRPPVPESPRDEVLVVQTSDAYVAKRGNTIVVQCGGKLQSSHPLNALQAICLYGAVQCSTQVLQSCLDYHIPVSLFSPAGKFLGQLAPLTLSGLDSRHGQYRIAETPSLALKIAARMISGKIQNQRTLLLRNASPRPEAVLRQLVQLRKQTLHVTSLQELLGVEGKAAALYFGVFPSMLNNSEFSCAFKGRNKRPPKDPVNAMLSLGYSVLSSEITGICTAIGLDPACGIMHVPRFGRPALALDLMEEFRPLIVDSCVISLINRNEIDMGDFLFASTGCGLRRSGHQAFWKQYARRMNEEVAHPVFQYRMSYRRMLEIQAAQLWRLFRGDVATYHPMTTR